jgi:hypothetical protein
VAAKEVISGKTFFSATDDSSVAHWTRDLHGTLSRRTRYQWNRFQALRRRCWVSLSLGKDGKGRNEFLFGYLRPLGIGAGDDRSLCWETDCARSWFSAGAITRTLKMSGVDGHPHQHCRKTFNFGNRENLLSSFSKIEN